MSKAIRAFFSIRLNLIIAIGYSFYSVLAICTCCSALRPIRALKAKIMPVVLLILQDTLSLQNGRGNKYGSVLYVIPLI